MTIQIKSKLGKGFFIVKFIHHVFFESDKETTPDLCEFGPASFSSIDSAIDCIKTWPGNINDYDFIQV